MKAIFILAMCTFFFTAEIQSKEPVLTRTAYGKITFGDRLEKVALDLNAKFTPENPDKACDFVTFAIYPLIKFMVEDGVITRGDAAAGVLNEFGISVGTLFSEVMRRFPDVALEMHPYDPQGHYVIFKSEDGKNAMIMEELDGKIIGVRGGLVPSVEYIEGCL
jgi:hypothetical protein